MKRLYCSKKNPKNYSYYLITKTLYILLISKVVIRNGWLSSHKTIKYKEYVGGKKILTRPNIY